MGKVKELLLDDDWDDASRVGEFPISVDRHPTDKTFYTVSYYGREVGFVQWSKPLQLWRAVSAVTHRVFHEDGQNAAINKVMEEMA
jgi:hypothetical protein